MDELELLKKLLKSGKLAALLEELEEDEPENIWVCTNCDHELESEKPKRKCPACGKFKLVKQTSNEADEEEAEKEYTELKEGICRREPIRSGRKMRFISESPDGNDFTEDRELFDKKVKARVSPRTRPNFKKKKVNCSQCGRGDEILPTLYYEGWICSKCIRNKAGV